ncbi:MAG: PEP-CTERM sorting domain-containing protein [Planctomycetota bacterium]
MKVVKFWSLCVTALLAFGVAANAATINEIRIDQGGGDDSEYFELAGTPGESLANVWYVVLGDTGGGTDGANGFGNGGIVEAAVDLTGNSIASDGFFLAVESSFENGAGEVFEGVTPDLTASFSFENGDNVTHLLVTDFTGSLGDDLDTDEDGVLNTTPWSGVLDAVGLLETPQPPSAAGEDFLFAVGLGGSNVGPNGTFVPAHVFRDVDGTGAFQIGAFATGEETETPGSSNVIIPEPASMVLVMLGATLAGMVGMRRKLG